jgi:hypothetical protein
MPPTTTTASLREHIVDWRVFATGLVDFVNGYSATHEPDRLDGLRFRTLEFLYWLDRCRNLGSPGGQRVQEVLERKGNLRTCRNFRRLQRSSKGRPHRIRSFWRRNRVPTTALPP